MVCDHLPELAAKDQLHRFSAEPGCQCAIEGGRRAAALRAMEIKAEVILKGTRVNGVYTADPMLDPHATKYPTISYLQVLERQLKVMDATAISLCMDNKLPIVVFDLREPGNIRRVVMGEPIGTTVS